MVLLFLFHSYFLFGTFFFPVAVVIVVIYHGIINTPFTQSNLSPATGKVVPTTPIINASVTACPATLADVAILKTATLLAISSVFRLYCRRSAVL
jgi:hypothetical protein